MFYIKKREDHAESDGENRIDFAWIVFVGMQIGYTEKEISRMYFGKWHDMYEQFKVYHNMKMRRCLFVKQERVSMRDL